MPRTRIDFKLELLVDEAPSEMLVATLEAVAAQLKKSPAQANGEIAGADGRLRWQVRSWAAGELVRCIGCGREVPRNDCDVTGEGERCRSCSLAGDVASHVEEATANAHQRGYDAGRVSLSDAPRLTDLLRLLK